MHGIDCPWRRHTDCGPHIEGELLSKPPARRLSATSFDADLVEFIATYAEMWRTADHTMPDLGERIGEPRKRQSERKAGEFLDWLEGWLRRYPKAESKRAVAEARLQERLKPFMADCLGFPDEAQDLMFGAGYRGATGGFVREARRFAGGIRPGPLFQALRNVWVANSIQVLLDLPVRLTPSIFAYSLLYPYTDNFLDSPTRSPCAKSAMIDWLTHRLAHQYAPPHSALERAVAALLDGVDKDYPPARFPEVHESLRAIHRAQVRSLAQQRSDRFLTDAELLELSLEKGGASVLADGYLAAGKLEKTEARFLFGYGALLQLLDDLQDCRQDRAVGHETLFSRAMGAGPLDEWTNRLHHFAGRVMDFCRQSCRGRSEALPALIEKSCAVSTQLAVAGNQSCFSRVYLAQFEASSPFSYSFLETQGKLRSERLRRATRICLDRF